jgi:hypothetical protein
MHCCGIVLAHRVFFEEKNSFKSVSAMQCHYKLSKDMAESVLQFAIEARTSSQFPLKPKGLCQLAQQGKH